MVNTVMKLPLRMMNSIVFSTCVLICLLAPAAYANTLTADVDRTQVSEDESLTLTLRYEGSRVNDDPDLSVLSQNFEVQSNGKSMKHSVVNGSVTSSTEWQVRLWPKQSGQLLIPPFTVNGVSSQAVRISVISNTETTNDAGTSNALTTRPVSVEASIDKTSVYVQEQVILTYRIYYRERFSYDDGGELVFDNGRVEALPNAEYQKTLNGAVFNVLEFRYAIFPDSSGTFTIPERVWQFQTNPAGRSGFGLGGGRQQLFRQKVAELSIEVKPKPADFPADASWMPATAVTLQESWSREPNAFKIGEPITRTLTLGARGQTAEQLPVVFDAQNDEQFKYYPDKPVLKAEQKPDGIIGMRQDSVAIVPSKAGELTLPAIEIPWWNVETNALQIARLPERVVTVSAAANAETPVAASITAPVVTTVSSTNDSARLAYWQSPWFWISIFSLLFNLILAIVFWVFLKQREPAHSLSQRPVSQTVTSQLKALRSQCGEQNAAAVRQSLLKIAEHLPMPGAATLSGMAAQANDPQYAHALMCLDALLFAGQSPKIEYERIYTITKQLVEEAAVHKRSKEELPELYATA